MKRKWLESTALSHCPSVLQFIIDGRVIQSFNAAKWLGQGYVE